MTLLDSWGLSHKRHPVQLPVTSLGLGTQVQLYFSPSARALMWRDYAGTEMLLRSASSHMPPPRESFSWGSRQCGTGTSHPFCICHKFLTHRIHAHKKWSFDATDFGGHCYATRVTGTDANSEPISMVREERRNQKAGGGCTSDYRAVCWPNWMTDSGKLKLPNGWNTSSSHLTNKFGEIQLRNDCMVIWMYCLKPKQRVGWDGELLFMVEQTGMLYRHSVVQLCLTLCDPVGCSTPGFSLSPSPGTCSNSCPLSQWCHPTISSSVVPFSCLQSFPALGSFLMNQFFCRKWPKY